GETCTLIASALRIILNGENCVIIILMDITENEKMEEMLESRHREINNLFNRQIAMHTASAIAHELNQPLLAVSAYCEAASRMVKTGNTSDKRLPDALESAVIQTKRAAQSLREMLNQLNKPAELVESLDLNREIMDALDILSANLGGNARITLELEEGLPAVLASRLHVQKVLLNLLNNSIEAMTEAEMAPEDMLLNLQTEAAGNFVQVTLTDNGPGLKEPSKVFTTFYTTKSRGMGMGLSISRSLIEDLGGKLWFVPSEGRGAIFRFTLPFEK
nr:ATP-binding protein [Burkholderiales bacterium]